MVTIQMINVDGHSWTIKMTNVDGHSWTIKMIVGQ